MNNKNNNDSVIKDEMEIEELNLDQLDNAAGGRGLRDVKKTQTHDIDSNTISRI